MNKCVECGSSNLVKERIGQSDEKRVICKDCGLLQIKKEEYLLSINKEKEKIRFYKIMRTNQIKQLLSKYKEGKIILDIIDKIDDEYQGGLMVSFSKFEEYLEKHDLEKEYLKILRELNEK